MLYLRLWSGLGLLLLVTALLHPTNAFAPQQSSMAPLSIPLTAVDHRRTRSSSGASRSDSRLFFFGRNSDNENDKDDKETDDGADEAGKKEKSLFGFFNREKKAESTTTTTEVATSEDTSSTTTTTKVSATTTTTVPSPKVSFEKLSVEDQVEQMRKDAKRARLEAELMDMELTMRKVERLQARLESSKTEAKDAEQLQRDLNVLVQKLEAPVKDEDTSSKESKAKNNGAVIDSSAPNGTPQVATVRATTSTSTAVSKAATTPVKDAEGLAVAQAELMWPKYIQPYDEENFKSLVDSLEIMPDFMASTLAYAMELQDAISTDTGDAPVNKTAVAVRLDQSRRFDYSYSSKLPPTFTKQQLANCKKKLEKMPPPDSNAWDMIFKNNNNMTLDDKAFRESTAFTQLETIRDKVKDTDVLARLLLEIEYYDSTENDEDAMEQMVKAMSQEEWLKPFLTGENNTFPTMLDSTIGSFYPKCVTKVEMKEEDMNEQSKVPTEAQVQQLIADVLPKSKFKATSKPEKVIGGYIIRGISSAKDGDDFVDTLDAVMEKSNLKDKMTVLYTADFSVFTDEDDSIDPFVETPPVLYVVAPNICRDPMPIQLSIVSALGIATSWYLSLYPFLLNPTIASRVDEQLAIADANMAPDLAWLTDLSLPLFTTFVAIQLIHEMGHLVAAGANNINTTAPTFVPSIITGITSSVTTFKSPPKNKAAMFDFSISGPLAGMLASIACVLIGSQLTTVSNPAYFPALPLEILRQSTLGGGIIEEVLGNGALSVPDGALGTAAVAGMTVPLHPVAVAGYISLIVNALAVLPIGTTDGGRAALALFGRGAKLAIGNLFASAVLLFGILGSDLFLFYFAFFIAFQAGNEIPSRNEFDKIDLPRVFLAAFTYLISALVLIPFQ